MGEERESLTIDVNEMTLDDLIWLSEWMERRDTNSIGDLRALRDLIVRCGNWTAEQVGGLKVRQMQEVLVAAFQAAKQSSAVPFAKENS